MTETRTQTVTRFVRAMLHQTSVSLPTFSVAVVQHYHERTPLAARAVLFHTGGDTYTNMRANAQIIRRFLEGEQRLPCELEEALVLSLPTPWRAECLAVLARRYGLLAAPIPQPGKATTDIAALFREAGEAGHAIAQWLDQIPAFDPRDRELADSAEKELHDVIAAATSLLERINTARRAKDKECPRAH